MPIHWSINRSTVYPLLFPGLVQKICLCIVRGFLCFFLPAWGRRPLAHPPGRFFLFFYPINRLFLRIKEFFACTQLINTNIVNTLISRNISPVCPDPINFFSECWVKQNFGFVTWFFPTRLWWPTSCYSNNLMRFLIFFSFEKLSLTCFCRKVGQNILIWQKNGHFITLGQNVTAKLDKRYGDKMSQILG